MIKEVIGNIALSKADAIVQGIAPNETFEEGVAHELAEKRPALIKDFGAYRDTKNPKPGGLWVWESSDGPNVVSLFVRDIAKDHSGKATASNIDHSLKELRKLVSKKQLKSLAVPKLGTGAGDMDWREVKPLIEQNLGDLNIPVYLYTIHHPIAAVED